MATVGQVLQKIGEVREHHFKDKSSPLAGEIASQCGDDGLRIIEAARSTGGNYIPNIDSRQDMAEVKTSLRNKITKAAGREKWWRIANNSAQVGQFVSISNLGAEIATHATLGLRATNLAILVGFTLFRTFSGKAAKSAAETRSNVSHDWNIANKWDKITAENPQNNSEPHGCGCGSGCGCPGGSFGFVVKHGKAS